MAGIDSYCKLMLHGNGDDGSQTIVDSEATPKDVTCVGNAQIDTAQKVFGTGSILFDGTGDAVTCVDSPDWDNAGGNFTYDFWVRWATVGTTVFACQRAGTVEGWQIYLNNTTHRFYFQYWVGTTYYDTFYTWEPVADTWYHVAWVRSGADLKLFIDGTQIGSTFDISTQVIDDSDGVLRIGGTADGTLNGWIDEFRISKGVARWTSNFTPPTEEYDSATVYALTVTETCTMTEVKPLNSTVKSFSDGVTLTDIKPLKNITKAFSDSVIMSDIKPFKGITKAAFSDSVTLTEIKPIKEISKSLTDSVTLSELTLTREITKTFSDSVTLTDTVNRILSALRTFSETVTLTEEKIIKEIQISKIESVTLTEIVAKAITKSPFTESVTLTDLVHKIITLRPFVESCTLTDSINKTIIKLAFVDSMTITERYTWWAKASEKSTVWSITTAGTTVWIAVSTSTSSWSLST